jgi:photosystem II stability/assembly factor-like uncharacterized protein
LSYFHRRFGFVLVGCLTLLPFTPARAQQLQPNTLQEMHWRMIGPFRGGRTRAVAGVPGQPNVFYIGQVNGGVWKSDDYGRTWNPIFDSQPTQSIGAIAVAPSDPNIIYVASGEGLHRPDLSVGDGIYRSSDAGKTWTHLGLNDAQQIPAIVVDPRDPNRVMAAVLGHPYGPSQERGVYCSNDGGQHWDKVLYKDENTGASDIEIDPSNPDVLYAGMWEAREGPWEDNNLVNGTGGGLFKTTDGGTTWKQLTNGLPKDLAQVNVSIAASDPRRLYAIVGTTQKGDYASDAGLGLYRSDDAGESWSRATSDPRPAFRIGGGDLAIPRVDPKNPDVIYVASLVTMKSMDGGKTWTGIRGAPGGDDYQNLWINPSDPKIILLVSDQGAIITVNGGATWSSWYNQPTAQLYHVAVSNTFPYRVCSGQQESGSVCISSRGNDGEVTYRDWHPVGTIEYGYVAPDPLDADIVYGAGRTEVSKFHWSTGEVQNITPIPVRGDTYRAERTEPILFSPVNPHLIYYAANMVFQTTDGGNSWQTISPDLTREQPGIPTSVGKLVPKGAEKQRGAVYSLAPSFKNVNTLWAGTDDGLIWITRNDGKNWNNITPPALTPWSKVTQISASHYDEDTAYVSVSRFRIDDQRPYIYRTHDGGKSWQLITTGLPDQGPADTVREDSVRKGLLFAGTENAVWVSFDDGDHWQSLQLNLPHTSMRDLWIHDNDLIVGTHGRSFWILDDISPLRQMKESMASSDAFLFAPAPAYRVRRSTYTDTPVPPDEPAGENPPDGAIVDYFVGDHVSGPVSLEVLDPQGKVVRKYSSNDQPFMTQAELEKQLIPLYWIRFPRALPTSAGMHRWVWDLHYTEPLSTQHEFPISAVRHDTPRLPLGPFALPGTYTVRLTAGGKSYNAPLTIQMDPRVKASASDLKKEFDLATSLVSMLNDSSLAVMQAKSIHEQLDKLKQTGMASDAAKAFDQKVTNVLEGPADKAAASTPALSQVNTSVFGLYGAVEQASAAPTRAQQETAKTLESNFDAAMKSWNDLKANDLPKMNSELRSAGQSEIQLESNPKMQDSAPNEE